MEEWATIILPPTPPPSRLPRRPPVPTEGGGLLLKYGIWMGELILPLPSQARKTPTRNTVPIPTARVAAARGDDRPGLRDRIRVLLAPLGSGGRPGHSVRRAATRRRQRPPATLMSPTDATRVVRFQRRPGTVSAEVRAIGVRGKGGRGEGGKEAKIERE